MIKTTYFETPLGRMLAAAEDNALTGLWFIGQRYYPRAADGWVEDDGAQPFAALRTQLDEYFAGTRREFDLPLNPGGSHALGSRLRGNDSRGSTPFQRAVWSAIGAVPFGNTTSYAALAMQCGRPMAARASGGATGRNPISLLVPCHRIVGSSGALTGYAGGLDRKRALLAFERAVAAGERCGIDRFVRMDAAATSSPARTAAQSELALR